jgi:hypothetical protein
VRTRLSKRYTSSDTEAARVGSVKTGRAKSRGN